MTTAIVDGDLVAFRCAASAEGEEEAWVACARAENFIKEILESTGATSYEVWLTGTNNFRYEVYPEYKANRKDGYRPKWEKAVKEYLQVHHDAQVLDNAEADDALGFRMYEVRASGESAICVTNDKDLKQIEGDHYDPVKKEIFTVTPEEADRWFYYQMLVGDPVDNLKGAKGIGKVKAEAILRDIEEAYSEDRNKYFEYAVMEYYPCEEAYEQAAKCTWIWRERDGVWQKKHI